jgi:hypothetical protein
MTTTDPALKQLLADADEGEGAIPLTLYLPSGRLFGHTTTHDDFGRFVTHEIGQQSSNSCVVYPKADPEYVHLIVKELSPVPGDDDSLTVVRVRLADVVAWSV